MVTMATSSGGNRVTMAAQQATVRVNVGCGSSPTPGWVNFDNSLSVRAARWPLLCRRWPGCAS